MAGDEEKKESEEPKKGGKGKLIIILVTPVLIAGAGVAGALVGPKFIGGGADIKAEAAEPEPEPTDVPKGITVNFKPIVVDIRDAEGAVHHIKVTLAAELKDQIVAEEFEKVQPRGREAAIAYLRTQNFDSVTDPKKFDEVREALGTKVTEAIGGAMINRVLVVDFVGQ